VQVGPRADSTTVTVTPVTWTLGASCLYRRARDVLAACAIRVALRLRAQIKPSGYSATEKQKLPPKAAAGVIRSGLGAYYHQAVQARPPVGGTKRQIADAQHALPVSLPVAATE
jgi:hypothetical protein